MTISNDDLADQAQQVHDVLIEKGRCKGTYWEPRFDRDYSGGSVCLEGAIAIVQKYHKGQGSNVANLVFNCPLTRSLQKFMFDNRWYNGLLFGFNDSNDDDTVLNMLTDFIKDHRSDSYRSIPGGGGPSTDTVPE